MTRARDIANLVDANGDIVAGALDNVPAADLVNDTTPQLGGALDAQSNNITSVGTLGVGTSSTGSETLVVEKTSGVPTIRVNAPSGSEAQLKLQADGQADHTQLIHATTGEALNFSRWTGSSYDQRMLIDSTGYVTYGRFGYSQYNLFPDTSVHQGHQTDMVWKLRAFRKFTNSGTFTFNQLGLAQQPNIIKVVEWTHGSVTYLPIYGIGGAGVGYYFAHLDPDSSWNANQFGLNFSWTDKGSSSNVYTITASSGNGRLAFGLNHQTDASVYVYTGVSVHNNSTTGQYSNTA